MTTDREHLLAEIDAALARVKMDATRLDRDKWMLLELRERVRKGSWIPQDLATLGLIERWAVSVTPLAAVGCAGRP